MNKLMAIILLLFPIITMATPNQQLSDLLSNFHSMQANFVQTVNNQRTTGTMALQRPGKFRWQVNQPNKQIIIADGDNIWIYDVDLEQAIKQKMDAKYNVNPAMLLTGSITELQKYFTVTTLKTNKPGQWFELKPKQQQNTMFQAIQIQFVNQQLKSMLIIDNMGNHSAIIFSNVVLNSQLKSALFKFVVPKGVDVIGGCDPKAKICPIPINH